MARRTSAAPTEKLKGELVHFSVRGQDFWGTGAVRTKHDGGEVTVTGKLLGAKAGDTVELEGQWDTHPRWGKQFKVTNCTVVIPSDAVGVVGWLACHLPQVSKRRAEQLVERHGVEGVWRILDHGDTAALCELEGITPPRAQEILEAYRANRGERDRMVRLKSWGLTDNQIGRVVAEWGEKTEQTLQANPYLLIDCVAGFGWKRADDVAKRMGVALDAPARIGAGLLHFMTEASGRGHCFVVGGQLVAVVAVKVLGGVEDGAVRRVLEQLVGNGKLTRHGANVYLPKLAEAEADLATVFARRAAGASSAASAGVGVVAKKEERAA